MKLKHIKWAAIAGVLLAFTLSALLFAHYYTLGPKHIKLNPWLSVYEYEHNTNTRRVSAFGVSPQSGRIYTVETGRSNLNEMPISGSYLPRSKTHWGILELLPDGTLHKLFWRRAEFEDLPLNIAIDAKDTAYALVYKSRLSVGILAEGTHKKSRRTLHPAFDVQFIDGASIISQASTNSLVLADTDQLRRQHTWDFGAERLYRVAVDRRRITVACIVGIHRELIVINLASPAELKRSGIKSTVEAHFLRGTDKLSALVKRTSESCALLLDVDNPEETMEFPHMIEEYQVDEARKILIGLAKDKVFAMQIYPPRLIAHATPTGHDLMALVMSDTHAVCVDLIGNAIIINLSGLHVR